MSTSNVVKTAWRPRTPLGELTALPRPVDGGEGPEPHPAVLYSELWLYISKLLDVIMVG